MKYVEVGDQDKFGRWHEIRDCSRRAVRNSGYILDPRFWFLGSRFSSSIEYRLYGLTAVPSLRRTGLQYPGCSGSGNLAAYKVLVFVIGAAMASLARVIYAHYISFIDSTSFAIMESICIVSVVTIEGSELLTALNPKNRLRLWVKLKSK